MLLKTISSRNQGSIFEESSTPVGQGTEQLVVGLSGWSRLEEVLDSFLDLGGQLGKDLQRFAGVDQLLNVSSSSDSASHVRVRDDPSHGELSLGAFQLLSQFSKLFQDFDRLLFPILVEMFGE